LIAHFDIFYQQEVNWFPKQLTCDRGTRNSNILVSDSIKQINYPVNELSQYKVDN